MTPQDLFKSDLSNMLGYEKENDDFVKARVIVRKLYDSDSDNDWPDTFISVPRKGEQVRTPQGRTLTVLDVVHTKTDSGPELHIEVGVESDAVTPTEGGEPQIGIG